MERSALCFICGKATKSPHSCTFCGAIVCGEHYDTDSGMCSRCKERLKRIE
ncbi:MAG: orotate phosphoribosyltransferase [Candidatus Aenigmarchaeota archaeon]|nr:orotate phosphoribosyltransferase [Candidatus Aenigmarchaeota archaeon]NIP41066.1 orotate phosphoribosyltransferase [Candidatus Aenigmarchaeota archaeon]NIQ17468.1 orotate phosphoribosyltransferase [Candidatus Aenigmarchaeota archaeon]NIS73662.1 orotate phosphoribosyltransferase [Candidatus Aenigmarchaeota archaeon]